MLSAKEKSLLEALEPRAGREGIEIVTVEVVGSRKAPTIRVYIDAENGVLFDDIAAAQAWINEIMDEVDPFPGAYTLEVSSPGIDRPLRTPEHFARAVGEEVRIVTASPIDGRSRFVGRLVGVSPEEGSVLLELDGEETSIALSDMKKAHVKGTVEFK